MLVLAAVVAEALLVSPQYRTMPVHSRLPPLYMQDCSSEPTRDGLLPFDASSIMKAASIVSGLSAASLFPSLLTQPAFAAPTNVGTVVVLGSNGKTGQKVVELLSKSGVSVRATNRKGVASDAFDSIKLESFAAADVTKPETLDNAVMGASCVVFAASASSKGGNAKQVDFKGVENAAGKLLEIAFDLRCHLSTLLILILHLHLFISSSPSLSCLHPKQNSPPNCDIQWSYHQAR